MFNSLLYLATRSVLHGAPVFICPAFVATATSANVVSSVSPLLCDTTAVYPFLLASSIASNVSVNVPIWFNLINILLAVLLSIPFCSLLIFVTNRSSPTSWTLSPTFSVKAFQDSQSSSANPSSTDIIGYLLN